MLGAPSSGQKTLCSRLLKVEKILGEGGEGGGLAVSRKMLAAKITQLTQLVNICRRTYCVMIIPT